MAKRITEAEPAAPVVGPRRGAAPGRREQSWFRTGVAVIALHVADDSFVQPQPGT